MLNDAKLRGAKPQDKAYKLTDSHRLYLEVKPSGGKLWRWNDSYDGKHCYVVRHEEVDPERQSEPPALTRAVGQPTRLRAVAIPATDCPRYYLKSPCACARAFLFRARLVAHGSRCELAIVIQRTDQAPLAFCCWS